MTEDQAKAKAKAKAKTAVTRLRWVGVALFLSGVVVLFAGAALKATGTGLLILLYTSFFLVTAAVVLFGIDWLRRRFTTGAKNDERERERERITGR